MKVLLDTFRQAQSKSNTWLIPVFEGKLAAAAKTYGFDPRSARTWGFEGKTGQSLTIALAERNQHALLIGAGKAKYFTTDEARFIIVRAVRNGAVQKAKIGSVVFCRERLGALREILAKSLPVSGLFSQRDHRLTATKA